MIFIQIFLKISDPQKIEVSIKFMILFASLTYQVVLVLRKAYDAIGRKRCMEILVGYRVVPRMKSILHNYCDHLSMVSRAGCCCVTPFKVHQGVNQVYPLSPTTFKNFVDAVISHWVMLVVGE